MVGPSTHGRETSRQIAGGHFLVAEESAHAVRDYSAEGKLVREIKLRQSTRFHSAATRERKATLKPDEKPRNR
jgi:hypothetical protein